MYNDIIDTILKRMWEQHKSAPEKWYNINNDIYQIFNQTEIDLENKRIRIIETMLREKLINESGVGIDKS